VVLAAGFGSPLTRQLGLGSVPDYATGIQAEVSTKDVDDISIYLGHDVAPGFFAWAVPTLPQRALVGLLARRGAPSYLARFLQRLRSEGKVIQVLKEATSWAIPLRPLRRTYQDRVLVVGDAAGQVKPTSGGGIYYSLLASEIAAEVLATALAADDLSATFLRQYQRRWQALLSRELEMGYSARRLYEFLTDQQISSLVRKAASNGIPAELVTSAGPSFDWHSHMIAKVISHPVLGRALRLVNPVLARLAYSPSDPSNTALGSLIPPAAESAR
jgi:flavin-dependent dehydrogenase